MGFDDMYNHPLSKHYEASDETEGQETCNSWAFVSGLTHAYFEEEDTKAQAIMYTILSDSGASGIRIRRLIRSFKVFRTLPVLREIQCLLAITAEQQATSFLSEQNEEDEEVPTNLEDEEY